MLNKSLFSSSSGEWGTPTDLYQWLHHKFKFVLDAAADYKNAKCKRFFNKADNSLEQSWGGKGSVVWLNPPYGLGLGAWMEKCVEEAKKGATVVALIPSRTDTQWWAESVMQAKEIWFFTGRLRFEGAPASAPFPSAIAVFKPGKRVWPAFKMIDSKTFDVYGGDSA